MSVTVLTPLAVSRVIATDADAYSEISMPTNIRTEEMINDII